MSSRNKHLPLQFAIMASVLIASVVGCTTPPDDDDETAVAASELQIGRYRIIHFDGRCLDVTDISQLNGAPLQLWDCAAAEQPNQIWSATPLGTTAQGLPRHHFVSMNSPPGSGKSIDVDIFAGPNTNGARFQQWDSVASSNQLFGLSFFGHDFFRVVAEHSGKCMETVGGASVNGTKIQQSDCAFVEAQLWRFQRLP